MASEQGFPDGFSVPDWNAPLDPASILNQVPENATLKGMYFDSLLKELERNGLEPDSPESRRPFLNYSLKEYLEFVFEVARKVHPNQSVRQGVRHMGRLAYPTFADTMIGKVTFGVLGGNVGRIIQLSNRAYKNSLSMGEVQPIELQKDWTILHYKDIYLVDSYQFGALEGFFACLDCQALVASRKISDTEGELYARWWK